MQIHALDLRRKILRKRVWHLNETTLKDFWKIDSVLTSWPRFSSFLQKFLGSFPIHFHDSWWWSPADAEWRLSFYSCPSHDLPKNKEKIQRGREWIRRRRRRMKKINRWWWRSGDKSDQTFRHGQGKGKTKREKKWKKKLIRNFISKCEFLVQMYSSYFMIKNHKIQPEFRVWSSNWIKGWKNA